MKVENVVNEPRNPVAIGARKFSGSNELYMPTPVSIPRNKHPSKLTEKVPRGNVVLFSDVDTTALVIAPSAPKIPIRRYWSIGDKAFQRN